MWENSNKKSYEKYQLPLRKYIHFTTIKERTNTDAERESASYFNF